MSGMRISPLWTVIALGLLVGTVLAGCASSRAGTAADVPTTPPAPMKKAFQPPSYEALEYANEELGFSVHYPSELETQEVTPGGLFSAASPNMVPRLDINLAPRTGADTLEELAAQVETAFKMIGGGEAKVTASKETTLKDGVTPASELLVDWTFQGFPISSVVLSTLAGDQRVNVSVTTMQGGDMEPLKEIVYTLYFK